MENKNFRIQIMNHIAERGIAALVERGCTVGKDVPDPQGILLRSADLHDYPFGDSLLVIARSGAGTNNIPLKACCEKGIVVFNSPGANAEAVKELIICSMVMSSRDVLGSIDWVKSLKDKGDEIPLLVEKGKAAFSGPELTGKTLGVIGLGAIGSLIANIAVKLGMNVIGFDPYLSVDAAWRLSRSVQHAVDVDEIFIKSDYISRLYQRQRPLHREHEAHDRRRRLPQDEAGRAHHQRIPRRGRGRRRHARGARLR